MLDDQIGDPRPMTLESQPVVPNTMPATQSASIISDSQNGYTAEGPPNAIHSAFILLNPRHPISKTAPCSAVYFPTPKVLPILVFRPPP